MDILSMPGPFGPAAAAFWLVSRENGFKGIKTLWKRGWALPCGKQWLIVSFFLMPVIALLIPKKQGESKGDGRMCDK